VISMKITKIEKAKGKILVSWEHGTNEGKLPFFNSVSKDEITRVIKEIATEKDNYNAEVSTEIKTLVGKSISGSVEK